jgi:tetratricopeptide (TPR) repeat protein
MKRIAGLLAAILLSAVPLFAQCSPYPESSSQKIAADMGEGGVIRGHVRYPDGKPVVDVELTLEPLCGWGTPQTTTTSASGSFSFSNVTSPRFLITGSVPGYKPIREFNGPLNITLRPLPGGPIPPTATVPAKYASVPPEALAQFDHGVVEQERGKGKEAEADFLKAIKIYPSFADAYMRLSAVYANQKRFDDAHKAIGNAIKLNNHSADAYAYLGNLYLCEKKTDKAEAAIRKSLSISDKDWLAHLEMGRLRYGQKRYAQAYAELSLACQLHPQSPSANLLLYDDLIQLRKYTEALVELDKILKVFPKLPEAAKLKRMRPALAAAAKPQQ